MTARNPDTREKLKALLDWTPTGGLKLPKWKAPLRADAAVLATTDKQLTPEYRRSLVERLGTYQRFIDAALSRARNGGQP